MALVAPLEPHNSTCGYCGGPGTRSEGKTNWHQAECLALQMSCMVYQKMIDRGWRRSGTYCYKPDLRRSCCPQYTIKLDVLQLKPSRSQRQIINRWNRFILHGDGNPDTQTEPQGGTSRNKGKNAPPFSLSEAIHASELDFLHGGDSPKHIFEVILEPASFSEEKFALYQSYEAQIHHKEEKVQSSFEQFLVESPLRSEPIVYRDGAPNHLPRNYGSYHQMYKLDGELFAMGVIDILPHCVSSVYFMYEKKWEKFSVGKLSALREASLAKEMHDAGAVGMTSLYMGFYIYSCPKMRYKGDYSPSYLADPEEYTWFPIAQCLPLLEEYRYVSFAHPEHNLKDTVDGLEDSGIDSVPADVLRDVHSLKAIENGRPLVMPLTASSDWRRTAVKQAVSSFLKGVGPDLAREIVLYLAYI